MTTDAPRADDPRSWPVRRTESFGGVVIRTVDGTGAEVALIRPRRDGETVWALPKGMREEGESPQDAALREVREETGLLCEIVEALDPVTYWFSWPADRVRYRKTVHFFLMRPAPGVPAEPRPDGCEVDEVRFFPLAEARRTATYRTERDTLAATDALVAAWT